MEHIEKALEELGFSKPEITTLLDETKKEEHAQIISDCRGRYNDVLIKQPEVFEHFKTDSKLKEFFKKELEVSVIKEQKRKDRKQLNADLQLGLSNNDLEEMSAVDFAKLVKGKSGIEESQKVIDLQKQYEEEKRLRELAENKLTEEVEKVKTEFSKKDVQREVELRKSRVLAAKDSAKFDKSNPKAIERAIIGEQVSAGVDFIIEDGKVYVTKDGQKMRDKSNNFVEYEDWIAPVLADFEVKQRGTPNIDPATGQPAGDGKNEMSEHAKKMAADLEKRGIKVFETA